MQSLLLWESSEYDTNWVRLFVVLGNQHEMRMCLIVICMLLGSMNIFHIFSRTAQFKKKSYRTPKVFWFSLQNCSEIFLILRTNERDRIKHVRRSSRKYPFILVRFQWNLNYRDRRSKDISNIKFCENVSSGSRLFHAGGQVWRT